MRTERHIGRVFLALMVSAQLLAVQAHAEALLLPEEPLPEAPVVLENRDLSTGQETFWDCVYFGSYPSAEVVRTDWDAVDSYAVLDGDVIRDDDLYRSLETADWQGDRVSVEGRDYIRINAEDAGTASENREQHYRWGDLGEWHYFLKEPVRWRVLSAEDDQVLLLADRLLDCRPFHEEEEGVTWERSTIRSWLNGLGPEENLAGLDYSAEGAGFFTAAFTEKEREAVRRSAVRNSGNYYFGTDCGEDTEDAVFLLSEEEVFSSPDALSYGFQPSDAVGDLAKRIVPTAYAQCRGAWRSSLEESEGNGFWFFRSNGYTASNVVYAGELGYIYNRGIPVTCRDASIVPAIRVDLDSAQIIPDGIIETALPDSIFEDAETETEVLTEAE